MRSRNILHILTAILCTYTFLAVVWEGNEMAAAPVAQTARKTTEKSKHVQTGKGGGGATSKKPAGSGRKESPSTGKSATKGSGRGSTSGKSAAPAKGNNSRATVRKPSQSVKPETSADVKKRQEATQKEIKLTEQQIRENDRSIKAGLSELGKLEGDINVSKEKISTLTGQLNTLNGRITTIEKGITANEGDLERLREEYLKAVKKMRLARQGKSALAFIFSSDNFNQALRRMRYLRQFSEWKDRQSSAIDEKTRELKNQRENLAKTRSEQDMALRRQKAEQSTLQQQHARQDAIVAELRQNGQALQSHLSKKQAEANQLRNQISQLIAQEERKAAEERARKEAEEQARREAAARKAEEERQARERREAEEAARLREQQLMAENAARQVPEKEETSKPAVKISNEPTSKVESKAVATARHRNKKAISNEKEPKKESKANELKNVNPSAPKSNDKSAGETKQNFADARKRRPRGKNEQQTVAAAATSGKSGGGSKSASPSSSKSASPSSKSSSPTASAAVGGDFSQMKGSLPKPVSGSFKVTSRFGRQSLPDLPDVVYDNPGIDAEVGSGASALAVYPGKISGVYMIPGFNTVVIVNHGNYYTVYGNIASPFVKVGDQVKAGQGLGSLAPDDDDRSHSSIHFEVWRNREKLNPLEWIR